MARPMKAIRFDEAALRTALSKMHDRAVQAFASAVASRLLQLYVKLASSTEIAETLIQSEDLLWTCIMSRDRQIVIEEDRLLGLIPDEDDTPSFPDAVLANTAAAIVYTSKSLRDDTVENAIRTARCAYDTAVRSPAPTVNEDPYTYGPEKIIFDHAGVQTELALQADDLVRLKADSELALEQAIKDLRARYGPTSL